MFMSKIWDLFFFYHFILHKPFNIFTCPFKDYINFKYIYHGWGWYPHGRGGLSDGFLSEVHSDFFRIYYFRFELADF